MTITLEIKELRDSAAEEQQCRSLARRHVDSFDRFDLSGARFRILSSTMAGGYFSATERAVKWFTG
jgi:hypothetical protein